MSAQQNEVLPQDPIERRRIQNRIAQRKFRDARRAKRRAREITANPTLIGQTGSIVARQGITSAPCLSGDASLDLDWIDSFLRDPPSISDDGDVLTSCPDYENDIDTLQFELPSTLPSVGTNYGCLVEREDFSSPNQVLSNTKPGVKETQGLRIRDDLSGQLTLIKRNPRPRSGSESVIDDWLTALHIAAAKGHDRILSLLLKPGRLSVDVNDLDGDGKTALYLATRERHEACVAVLLANGAKIDVPDKITGWNSMHWAVFNHDISILRLLLEHGKRHPDFDIDAFDSSGWTATHAAIEAGFEAGLELLLEHGANPNYKARRCIFGNVIPHEMENLMRLHLKQRASKNRG